MLDSGEVRENKMYLESNVHQKIMTPFLAKGELLAT